MTALAPAKRTEIESACNWNLFLGYKYGQTNGCEMDVNRFEKAAFTILVRVPKMCVAVM